MVTHTHLYDILMECKREYIYKIETKLILCAQNKIEKHGFYIEIEVAICFWTNG